LARLSGVTAGGEPLAAEQEPSRSEQRRTCGRVPGQRWQVTEAQHLKLNKT